MIPEYRHRALSRSSDIRWPIRLRLLLIIPGSWKWNGWVRGITARFEGPPPIETPPPLEEGYVEDQP